MLSPNVIIPFDGNHANIPAGFSRDTRFDGKIPKGASSGWGDTGGAETHSHTFTHSHAITSHTHTLSTGNAFEGAEQDMGNSGGIALNDHSHTSQSGASQGQTTASTAATATAYSSLPPYYEVIFIKSGAYNAIPVNGMVMAVGNRPGLSYHTASENRFLKGAAAGGNAGGTGGNSSHSHSQSHTHTATSHTHATSTLQDAHNDGEGGQGGNNMSNSYHHHHVDLDDQTQNLNSDTTASSTVNLEPYHKTIKHYKATQQTLPQPGDIAMITEAENPPGWITCDGSDGTPDLRDFYVKNTQTSGTIAGSNTHSHTVTHGHTGSGTHAHNPYNPTTYSDDFQRTNGGGKRARGQHRHNVTYVSSVTANYDSQAADTTTDSNEPEYIKVRYIQLKYTVAGGALLSLL